MALPGAAAFLAWWGAALVVSAGAAFALRRGWVAATFHLWAAVVLLSALLLRVAALHMPRRSGDPSEDAGVGPTLWDGVLYYVWLPAVAACVLCLVVEACVMAMRRRRRRGRVPLHVPGRRAHLVPRASV
ncbi:hypothetical protein ACP4OV_005499 [Aristida adscensionis]